MLQRLRRLLPGFRSAPSGALGHLTFGNTSVGRAVSRTGLALKKQLWIWPIVAVVVLAIIGLGIRQAIERTMQNSLRSQLTTLVSVERSMLETWLKIQKSNAESLATDEQVRDTAEEILSAIAADIVATDSAAETPTVTDPAKLSALRARLAKELSPGMSAHHFAGFMLADKDRRIVASANQELVGKVFDSYDHFLSPALEGQTTVSPPFASLVLMKDENGKLKHGLPTMFACAPIRDASFQVIGVLCLRIRPEREFTRILQLGQVGASGETYAIDKNGLLVSSSRFDEELIMLGVLPDVEETRSILTVSSRDPGGDLRAGFRPQVRRFELPLTEAAAAATAGTSGSDVDGYRDYRGVLVVGAWQWLPDYNLGVITEIDYDEAYRPLTILRRAFYAMFGLLALSSIAIFAFTVVVARLQREAQKAAIEAKHLGQYRLEEQLGAGAMGVVYRAQHAMLRRPTAVKMLNVERVNEASIQRFEREVQITCRLNHPNTVAIYDFGRTPEGVFYYAMEYLDGIDLQQLVERYGPQPEGRVIRILQQMCGSLYEAHTLGLVHRDVKPANVMINRRGAEPDVVKVLDFGLVRALEDQRSGRPTSGLAGTPLYMSPESIQTPELIDPRSDIYALGAVGYFLLTGGPVFKAASLAELCQQHIVDHPEPPSVRLGRPVSSELESALLACLEKSAARRPQTARDLSHRLERCQTTASWTLEEADAWWSRHERQAAPSDGQIQPAASNAAQDGARAAVQPSTSVTPATKNTGFDRTIDS